MSVIAQLVARLDRLPVSVATSSSSSSVPSSSVPSSSSASSSSSSAAAEEEAEEGESRLLLYPGVDAACEAVFRTAFAATTATTATTAADAVDEATKRDWEMDLRGHLYDRLSSSEENDDLYRTLVTFLDATYCCYRRGYLGDVTLSFLEDVLDTVTLTFAERMYEYFESRAVLLTKDMVPDKGKGLTLLRLSNQLLRRLSKSKNTVFSGRIRSMMANVFPLCERSGVNLQGSFNIENATTLDDGGDSAAAEQMPDPDNGDASSFDYKFYKNFWMLQNVFASPRKILDPATFRTFSETVDSVLTAFQSFKNFEVRSSSGSSKQSTQPANSEAHNGDKSATAIDAFDFTGEDYFFPKFLTSKKLLHLELNDPGFHRHILVQFAVLFDYLLSFSQDTAAAKKPVSQASQSSFAPLSVSEKQEVFLRDAQRRVIQCLEKTPPNGVLFTKMLQAILARETNWVSWKTNGCKTFEKEPLRPDAFGAPTKRRRVAAGGAVETSLGGKELTRLWNIAQNNDEYLQTDRRKIPTVTEYLEPLLEQMKPEDAIEKEYRLSADAIYVWKCVRIMSMSMLDRFQSVKMGTFKNDVKFPDLEDVASKLLNPAAASVPTVPVSAAPATAVAPATAADGDVVSDSASASSPGQGAPDASHTHAQGDTELGELEAKA